MERLTRLLTDVGVFIGGLFLVGVSIVITVEVLLRKFANVSLEGLHEISGFAMAVSFAWAMPFTILTRGHVRVDVAYSLMRARWKLACDLFAAFALALYLVLLVYRCFEITLSSWQANTLSSGVVAVPLAIPQALWTAGLAVACLVLLFALARACMALARRQTAIAAESLTPYAVHADERATVVGIDDEDGAPRGRE